jgi:hypothetical protein
MSLVPDQAATRHTVACPNCRHESPAGSKFCERCGTALERVCTACGKPLRPGAKFCSSCGLPVSQASASEPPAPPAKHAPPPVVAATACSHCGSRLKPGAKFCGVCGQPVAATMSQPQAAAPITRAPVAPPRAARPAPASRRSASRLRRVVSGCAAVLMLVLIALVALFFALRSGALSSAKLLSIIGLGPGTIEVMNFRDDAIQIDFTEVKESGQSTQPDKTIALDAYGISSDPAVSRGTYLVAFSAKTGTAALGSCTLTVRAGDLYRFVALANGIIVDRDNSPSSKGEDLILTTSAYCR